MRPDWREKIDDLLQLPYAYCEHTADKDSKSEYSHIIKAILLVRDADGLLEVRRIGGGIHEGQLEVDRAVEKVEKTAPSVSLISVLFLSVLLHRSLAGS